jgi:RNA polymerase sigma-70 factor (ECF subfamily)
MADAHAPAPTQEEALRLYQRLLDADPTAPSDLAAAYLEPLVLWLNEHNRGVAPEFCIEAAEDAVLALIRRPDAYRPDRLGLEAYLRMAAQGDLRNLLRGERRHHRHREPWEVVELSPGGGKYSWQEDPSLPLQIAEEQRAAQSVPDSVREGLSEPETRVLELMLRGERKTSAYAAAYGIGHLPVEEQRREVKRVKDRLKKRWERAGGADEPVP